MLDFAAKSTDRDDTALFWAFKLAAKLKHFPPFLQSVPVFVDGATGRWRLLLLNLQFGEISTIVRGKLFISPTSTCGCEKDQRQ